MEDSFRLAFAVLFEVDAVIWKKKRERGKRISAVASQHAAAVATSGAR